ncbi:MAG: hypothetical protein WB528_17075 [Bradyrhizobium sp.]
MSDDRYAEILQIVGRQAPKNLVVNLIIAKGGLVLPEADASQPFAHIHGHVLAMVRRPACLGFDVDRAIILCDSDSHRRLASWPSDV